MDINKLLRIFVFVIFSMLIWYLIYQVLPATLIVLTVIGIFVSIIIYIKTN